MIMKMLVYSEPGVVSLLPATPKAWAKGSIKGVALRGGILLRELNWNGNNVEATLLADTDQSVTISVFGKGQNKITLKAGKSTKFTNSN